jgi:hypothetical protein
MIFRSAFALVRGGGQGRGRTADLPLFRWLQTVAARCRMWPRRPSSCDDCRRRVRVAWLPRLLAPGPGSVADRGQRQVVIISQHQPSEASFHGRGRPELAAAPDDLPVPLAEEGIGAGRHRGGVAEDGLEVGIAHAGPPAWPITHRARRRHRRRTGTNAGQRRQPDGHRSAPGPACGFRRAGAPRGQSHSRSGRWSRLR